MHITHSHSLVVVYRGRGRFWWTTIPVKAKTCKSVRSLGVCWALVWPLNQLKSSKGGINSTPHTCPRLPCHYCWQIHLHASPVQTPPSTISTTPPSHPIPALNSRRRKGELSWAAGAAGLSDPGQSDAVPTTCPSSSLRNSDAGKSL